MRKHVTPDRLTANVTHDIVVFLIGARINKWWRVWEWFPVMLAMPRMLSELRANPDSGFLGSRGAGIQYWKSSEHLIKYAHDRDGIHFPAWAAFNRKAAKTSSVGIWHETFVVSANRVESLYHAAPRGGLLAFFEAVPAVGKRKSARQRLGEDESPEA